MCGFAGLLSTQLKSIPDIALCAGRMADALAHRGPDDSGCWRSRSGYVGLGFRRLAIVDLSGQGHQPMHSRTGRFTLVFNGEVYNHRQLRQELEHDGFQFRGHSDTEVLLASFERWGIDDAIIRFRGMFAIAVWDEKRQALSLVRDRLGIKPLFIHSAPGIVSFASELKALHAGPRFNAEIDRDALTQFLRYLYIPAPRTIYCNVQKLQPGHIVTITDADQTLPSSRPYWSAEKAARQGKADPFRGTDAEAIDRLEELLDEAVRLRMEADVPLGALLSGGIDSTTVVALLQRAATRPVKTFSIAFEEQEFNEAHHAARLAGHLGTDHTEVLLTGEDALAVVPKLPEIFDEPHADTSQIPAYLISGVARRQVTVALSGDGGDEVYGGYNRYTHGEPLFNRMLRVPAQVRGAVGSGIGGVAPATWDRAYRGIAWALPGSLRHRMPGDKLSKMGRLMRAGSAAEMYRSLVSAWEQPERLVRGSTGVADPLALRLAAPWPKPLLDRMMLADQETYLPDDQLAKIDRVSMAVSLEVRVPLLDHHLVEFSWRLPHHLKVRDGEGKWLLRQVLYRLVPREMVERPKMGLSVPIDQWLKGPLRPWAEELLDAERIRREGVLNPAPIRAAWESLLAGRSDVGLGVWSVLMFQAWHERWQPAAAGVRAP